MVGASLLQPASHFPSTLRVYFKFSLLQEGFLVAQLEMTSSVSNFPGQFLY